MPDLGGDSTRSPAGRSWTPDAAGPVDGEVRPAVPQAVTVERSTSPPVTEGGWVTHQPASEETVRTLSRRLADYTQHIENLNIAEYVELVRNPFRMFVLNLLSGIGRGVGIAIGFTVLGAAVLLLLQRLVMLNLPGIGGFISEIVRIVQNDLSGGP